MEVEDYPRTLIEFQERFATEEACRAYLEKLRWPEGFRCPGCSSGDAWRTKRGLWMCCACSRQTSVTSGTIFQDTRKPLRLWFLVMWHVTSQKNGVSALGLQRAVGFKRYETTWMWLHKLRRAMVRPGRDRLSGIVEVDETFVGGREHGVHGRKSFTKSLVAVAAQVEGNGIGRIRLRTIADASGASLLPFVEDSVVPGSVVRTDGWDGYEGLKACGYRHQAVNIKRSGKQAHEVMPRVHRVASLLKRWWLGTHHGSMGPNYLDYYLDEFTFRFNRRSSRARGKLFYRLVQQAALVDPVPWEEVSGG